MAKKKRSSSKRRRSTSTSKATRARRANLRKAVKARRSNKRRGGPKHKVKGYSYKRRSKRVRVKSHTSYEAPRKRRSSKRRRKAAAAEAAEAPRKRRSSKRRSRRARAAAAETPRKRRSSKRRSSKRRRHARAAEAPRSRRRRSSKRRSSKRRRRAHAAAPTRRSHKRRSRRSPSKRRSSRRRSHRRSAHMRHSGRRRSAYALENPLGGGEIAVGVFTGLLGYVAADVLDRTLATHPLNDKGAVGSDSKELWADPTGSANWWQKPYAGMYNATAVLAPYNWTRWVAGGLLAVVPFVAGTMVKGSKAPMLRSALQFFGFGAAVRVLGGAFDSFVGGRVLGRTKIGSRLFDGEARAYALEAGQDVNNYPSTGLGAPALTGVGRCGTCANCTTGVGACCRMTGSTTLPAPVGVPMVPGQPVAQPVMPSPAPTPMFPAPPPTPMVPVAPPQGRVMVPTPPVMFPAPNPNRPPTAVQGFPNGVGGSPARRSRFDWGDKGDQAAE